MSRVTDAPPAGDDGGSSLAASGARNSGSAAAPVGGGDSAAVEASSTPFHTGHSPTTGTHPPTVPERTPDLAGRLPGDPGGPHTTPLDGQQPAGALVFAPPARSVATPGGSATSGPLDVLRWTDGGPPPRASIAPAGRASRGGRADEALPAVHPVGPLQLMRMAQRLRDAAEEMSSAASDAGAFGAQVAGAPELVAGNRGAPSLASRWSPADPWRAERRRDKLPAAAADVFVATTGPGGAEIRRTGPRPTSPALAPAAGMGRTPGGPGGGGAPSLHRHPRRTTDR